MTDNTDKDGWKAVAGEMVEGARDAAFRFPVVALSLFLLTIYGNLEIADAGIFGSFTWHLPLGLGCAAIAALAATLHCEARRLSAHTTHIASLAAAVAAFAAIWFSGTVLVNELVLPPALFGLALVAPYLWRFSADAFWLFAVRFLFAVALGLLAMLLSAGGISAIFASLSYLFGFEIETEVYGHVWVTVGFLLAPLFGLGRLPRWYHDKPSGSDYEYMAVGIRALGDFVAAPLLLIYAIILHAYAAKIILTGEVPKGQIGWLVLAYGFCLFGSLLISYPYWHLARAPMRLLLRVWPFVLPVPLIMLFYAAWLRIDQYGVTPERYLLVLYGLVAAAIAVIQIFKPVRGDIRVIVALPVIAICLASFGPQGVNGWSLRSQADRFFELVERASGDVAIEAEAVSVLRYLRDNGGLARVAPAELELKRVRRSGRNNHNDFLEVAKAYDLNPDIATGHTEQLTFNKYFPNNRGVAVEDFDIIVPQTSFYNRRTTSSVRIDLEYRNIDIGLDDRSLTVTENESEIVFELTEEMIREIAGTESNRPYKLSLEADGRKLMMLINHTHGEFKPVPRFINISGTVLLRSQDWKPVPEPSPPAETQPPAAD